jgi:hypothetical protein
MHRQEADASAWVSRLMLMSVYRLRSKTFMDPPPDAAVANCMRVSECECGRYDVVACGRGVHDRRTIDDAQLTTPDDARGIVDLDERVASREQRIRTTGRRRR